MRIWGSSSASAGVFLLWAGHGSIPLQGLCSVFIYWFIYSPAVCINSCFLFGSQVVTVFIILEECARYFYLLRVNTKANDGGMDGGRRSTFPGWMAALFVQLYFLFLGISHEQELEFLISRKVYQSASNQLPRLIFWKQPLMLSSLWNPFPGLVVGLWKNVSRTQTCLMGWSWSCLLAKRHLNQKRNKVMMRNLRALTLSCQNTLCKGVTWLQKPFSLVLGSLSHSADCGTVIVSWT